MTDNELLLSISDMMDNKLHHITHDMQELKTDMKNLKTDMANLKTDMANLKTDMVNLKTEMAELKTEMTNLKNKVENIDVRVKKIEFNQENEILPRLNTIESCYTSTFDRYKDSVEDNAAIKQDISIMKKVIQEHSQKLQNIS